MKCGLISALILTGTISLCIGQGSTVMFDEFPEGAVVNHVKSNDTCYYYLGTTNNPVYPLHPRFHVAVAIDIGCDLDQLQIIELHDTVDSGSDFRPTRLLKQDGLFVEALNERVKSTQKSIEIINYYNLHFETIKKDSFFESFVILAEVVGARNFQVFGTSLSPSHVNYIGTFIPDDTTFVFEELDIFALIPTSFIFDQLENQYYFYQYGGLGILDSNYNVIKNVHATYAHTAVLGQLEFLDTNIISFGARLPPGIDYLWQVTFNLYDRELNLIEDETYGDTLEADYPFINECLDQSEDAIFTGAMLDMSFSQPQTPEEPLTFVITKYDRDRNMLWRQNFGGDAPYYMYGVMATPDGGCIAYGHRGNEEDGLQYPFLLKIDKNGLVTSSPELPPPAGHTFTLYGNPISEALRIHAELRYQGEFRVMLTTVLGQVVLSEPIIEGLNSFPVGHLAEGLYYYTILDETAGRVVESCGVVVAR